jgi:hypothetical protein
VVEGGEEGANGEDINRETVQFKWCLISKLQCKESTSVDGQSQWHAPFNWEKGSHEGAMHSKTNNDPA